MNVFVLGKGGVGKTTLSAAIANKYAENYKTLVVSLDPAHNLGDVFEKKLSTKPKKIKENLYASEVDLDDVVKDYIHNLQRSLKHAYRYLTVINLEKYFDVLKHYPGVEESALLEAMRKLSKEDYDIIIFDTPPTGLTVRIFTIVEMTLIWLKELINIRKKILEMRRAVEKIQGEVCVVINGEKFSVPTSEDRDAVIKEMRQYYAEIEEFNSTLRNENLTKFVAVLNPEPLSYLETKRIIEYLRKMNLEVGSLIINKYVENEISKNIAREFSNLKIFKVPVLDEVRGLEALGKIARFVGDL